MGDGSWAGMSRRSVPGCSVIRGGWGQERAHQEVGGAMRRREPPAAGGGNMRERGGGGGVHETACATMGEGKSRDGAGKEEEASCGSQMCDPS